MWLGWLLIQFPSTWEGQATRVVSGIYSVERKVSCWTRARWILLGVRHLEAMVVCVQEAKAGSGCRL